jgi:excisionase family DNA binding protein
MLPADETETVTIKGAADLLNVHPNTVRSYLARGKLPRVELSAKLVRIPRSAVITLLTPHAVEGRAE